MDAHRFAKTQEHRHGRLPFASFNVVDVLARDASFGRELLLGQIAEDRSSVATWQQPNNAGMSNQ
jgi:hypothetical protein